MAYRFTNTEKWNDSWFSGLKQFEKLLFIYLCDNCDIAGFIEINYNRWSADLGTSKETISGAIQGLSRGLIISNSEDCIYVRNFLKHQKNLPLNEKNNAHLGIIKRFEYYKNKFKIITIEEFINQDVKPLLRGYGNDSGNDSGKGNNTWKTNFEIYKSELNIAVNSLLQDKEWLAERQRFHPKLDIKLSIEKAYKDFWSTEAGWKHKKKSKSNEINWKSTFNSAIEMNKVYKQQ